MLPSKFETTFDSKAKKALPQQKKINGPFTAAQSIGSAFSNSQEPADTVSQISLQFAIAQ